jgi:hypothetical protein
MRSQRPRKAEGVTLRSTLMCWVLKNLRTGSQTDTDAWNGLFNTHAGPRVGVSRLLI